MWQAFVAVAKKQLQAFTEQSDKKEKERGSKGPGGGVREQV